MLKRFAAIGLAVCLCMGLCACSQSSPEENGSASESSESASPTKEEIKAYLSTAQEIVTETNTVAQDALACLTNGDIQGCTNAAKTMNEINSKAQDIVVPSTCEANYGRLKEYVAYSQAAVAGYAAASLASPTEQAPIIEEATSAVDDATNALNQYNATMREIPLPN